LCGLLFFTFTARSNVDDHAVFSFGAAGSATNSTEPIVEAVTSAGNGRPRGTVLRSTVRVADGGT
jgi:hypothetical protein